MRASAFCGFCLALTWASVSTAQELPAPLRWHDVVDRIDALPQLQEAQFRTIAAEAGVDIAGQVPNPEAELRLGRGLRRDGGTGGLEWGVGLTIPFDWIGPRGPEIRAAQSEADASREDAVATRREVLGRLATLFWKVAFDQRLILTLQETEEQVARLAGLVRLRVQKGESRPTELPRIETELERVRIDLGRARAEARADRRGLAVRLGLEERVELRVEADLSAADGGPPSRDDVTARVIQAHPRLAAAQARVAGREARVCAERARRIPGFSVGGFFDREPDQDSVGALFQVKLPIWNWNTGAIRRAEAERSAGEQAAEAAGRDLLADAGSAWERCVQGREAAARFDLEILPRAHAASRAVERGFELGETSLIDVLDARRVLLDVRKEQIAAGLQARVECTALQVLTGEINDGK